MPEVIDVIVSARKKLLADAAFSALVGTDVGKEISGPYSTGWVFRQIDDGMNPEKSPRNSGKSAVVIGSRRSWTNPNLGNTLRFPLLSFRVWSDKTRGADHGLPLFDDAEDRCRRIGTTIFNAFHDAANHDHWWPNGVYIVSCKSFNDLDVTDVAGEDGLVSGDMSFALSLG